MHPKKLDEKWRKLQSDCQNSLRRFFKKSDKLNDEYGGTIPGLTETMLFGLMWFVVKQKLKTYSAHSTKSEMNMDIEFTRSMFKKVLNEEYPDTLFEDHDGELVESIKDKKITIN
jgi:hypothetical protein